MGNLLESVTSPADLRGLSWRDLHALADELRSLIIEVVSRNRGHLASNLGVVELTIALHRSLDFDHDVLVWDCGHQTYAHKVLTGRRDRFDTLRQEGGITGFADRRESPYDSFTFGHTSTSVSAALGVACAKKRLGQEGRVVAVVGDGAIASGMAFEAMNHAGDLGLDVLLVLNDNRMSISRSVGAISHYLMKLRSGQPFVDIRRELQELLTMIPLVGERLERARARLHESLQAATGPGGLFLELGFQYYGLLDGHNIRELVDALNDLKNVHGPVLLHVVTEKGRGFEPARQDPARYHSSGRFELDNGTVCDEEVSPQESYSDVFGRALCQIAEQDQRIVAITAAMLDGTGLAEFAERFPDRFYDVGICEQHAVGLANGLAAGGLRPVFAVYSTFLQRAIDQVYHDIALQGAPVVLCIDRAGLVGPDGPTHHGLNDIAQLRIIPGFVLMAPASGAELRAMLRLALASDAPVAIRYPRETVPDGPDGPAEAPLQTGHAQTLHTGQDGAIIAYGTIAARALGASRILEEEGLSVQVINARFAGPLDVATILGAVQNQPAVIIAEDHCVAGGFGSAVLETLGREGLAAAHVRLVGVPCDFIPHASREAQLARCGLDAVGLAARLRELVGRA
jgi:1-deoxy-D-xylulose-5-phosphate synthase